MKGLLSVEDFLVVDMSGAIIGDALLKGYGLSLLDLEGTKNRASSETAMHLAVYNNQPLARCVFHAHPMASIAYTVAYPDQDYFPLDFISELVLALGQVPIVKYQCPGTPGMGDALLPHLKSSKVMMLQFHGVISWGEDIEESYRGIERIEHAVEIYLKALQMGTVNRISEKDFAKLKNIRKEIGLKTI